MNRSARLSVSPVASSWNTAAAIARGFYRTPPYVPAVAHIYWLNNLRHFQTNVRRYREGKSWIVVPTFHHGAGESGRATLNCSWADEGFVSNYAEAARDRGFVGGIIFQPMVLGLLGGRRGYEFANVQTVLNVRDVPTEDLWMYDFLRYRRGGMGALAEANVVRIAAPKSQRSLASVSPLEIPHALILSVWASPTRR